jgi:hypothetical protein
MYHRGVARQLPSKNDAQLDDVLNEMWQSMELVQYLTGCEWGAHLSEELHVEFLTGARGAVLAEDVLAVAALRAAVVAHVLDDAHYGHCHLPEHARSPPRIYQRYVLQQPLSLGSSATQEKQILHASALYS